MIATRSTDLASNATTGIHLIRKQASVVLDSRLGYLEILPLHLESNESKSLEESSDTSGA
jgi:hypothetical protein